MTIKNIKINDGKRTVADLAQAQDVIIGIPYYLYIDRSGVYKASAEEVQKTISVIEIADQINKNNARIMNYLGSLKNNNSDNSSHIVREISEIVKRNEVYGDILKTYCYQIID